jgi:6-phosphogluconate dehydrogenase
MSSSESKTGTAQIGVTGLAVMGSNLARNFAHHGYTVALHNRSIAKTDALLKEHGDEGKFVRSETIEEFLDALEKPRRVIIMVKAGDPTDAVINELADAMEDGDIIIDGGNALYTDTIRREKAIRERGLHFVGAGISGGEEGALNGPSIMPGGPAESYKSLGPLLEEISAHVDGVPCCTHVGPDGAGHFVKMVHNGIEYGLMAAYAEGLNVLKHANVGKSASAKHDAETAPLRNPEYYQYDLDLPAITEVWRRGSVVASWLLDLTAAAFVRDAALANFAGRVSDSGEGRWTLQAANDEGVPAHVLAAALFERFASRGEDDFQNRVLSAMRFGFGGHAETK